jgi:hypothetical protein
MWKIKYINSTIYHCFENKVNININKNKFFFLVSNRQVSIFECFKTIKFIVNICLRQITLLSLRVNSVSLKSSFYVIQEKTFMNFLIQRSHFKTKIET